MIGIVCEHIHDSISVSRTVYLRLYYVVATLQQATHSTEQLVCGGIVLLLICQNMLVVAPTARCSARCSVNFPESCDREVQLCNMCQASREQQYHLYKSH